MSMKKIYTQLSHKTARLLLPVLLIANIGGLMACGQKNVSSTADYIGIDAAKEAALKAADVSTEQAALISAGLDSKNGTFYYQVVFQGNGQEYEYDIDALTGVVIEEKHTPIPSESTVGASKEPEETSSPENINAQSIMDSQKNVSVQENADSQQNINTQKSADAQPNTDAQKGADAQQSTDAQLNTNTQKNPNAQNTDSQTNINAEQNTDSSANVNAQQNTNTQTNANTQQNTNAQTNANTQQNTNAQTNANTQQNANPKQNAANNSSAAGIDSDTALSIALSHAGLTEADITFHKVKADMENGKRILEVEFVSSNGTEYDYELYAEDGTILSYDYDAEFQFRNAPAAGTGIISEAQAKQAVLDRVPGAPAENMVIYLDEDDGRMEYEGKLFYDNMKYEFKIDAYSGGLIEWDAESVITP